MSDPIGSGAGASTPGMPAWVGIDLGTQSVRAVVVADDGAVLAAASHPLSSHRAGVIHEQDPDQWWSATVSVLREVTGATPPDVRVTALAVSATSGTVVVLDEDGAPTTPGIMYDDARGAASTEAVNAAGAPVWSRLGYRMQGSWALPTLMWLRTNGQLEPGRSIAYQPDIITSRLAGTCVPSDSSHALKSGLDLDSLEWPVEVMKALDVPLGALPDVVASGTVIGVVSATAAEETGLPAGCAIVAGMTDGCAAQLSAGALTAGAWNSVLGTTLVIKGMSAERHIDPTGAVYAHRAPFGAGWMPGGASSTGAGAISHWLFGHDLDALTAQVASDDRVPVAYPLVGRGERFPFVAPGAHAFFDGHDEPPTSDTETFSAIAHGVAFVERLSFDLLDLAGYDVSGDLGFTGGGARNAWWNQVRCDVLQRPVRVPAQGEGAVGMAVLAAAAMDEASSAHDRLGIAASRMLRDAARLEPSVARAPSLLGGYVGFVDELESRGWVQPTLAAHARGRAG